MIFFLGLFFGMHPSVWRQARLARAAGIDVARVPEFEAFCHWKAAA